MDREARTQVWYPSASDTLIGKVRHATGVATMIETEDGASWLLETQAENQVIDLRPEQGQLLKITATTCRDRVTETRLTTYEVELLDRGISAIHEPILRGHRVGMLWSVPVFIG